MAATTFIAPDGVELAERLGNVRAAIELPGVAHLPGLEDPGGVARLIADAVAG